jgi:hypothetical protein
MSTAVQIPAGMKPSTKFAQLDPTESLAEGIGSSYPVIGYKGKNFSIRHKGEVKPLIRPDDGTPVGYLDVVILRQAKVKAKSYYPDGFEEGGSAGKRPACASIDGVRPDPDVQDMQSTLCATCPRNEFKTGPNGKKTRECSDYKRLAVLVMPQQTTPLFGQPMMEPAFLRIPPASLNNLSIFGENMAQQGWPYSSFVTRVMFDPAKAHPEFTFKFLQGLTDAEADTILALREEIISKRITGEDEIARRALTNGGAVTNGNPVSAVPPQPAVFVPVASQPVVEALPNPALMVGAFGMGAATAAVTQQVQQAPQTLELTQAQPGGAFGVTLAPEPNQPVAQPGAAIGQSAEDVGEAVNDPDLDAQIAAMLATA